MRNFQAAGKGTAEVIICFSVYLGILISEEFSFLAVGTWFKCCICCTIFTGYREYFKYQFKVIPMVVSCHEVPM